MLALERELNGSAVSVFSSRIGIHTGDCVAGFLGDRVRPDYSLVGLPADIAARLEGLNDDLRHVDPRFRDGSGEAAGPGFLVRMLGTISAGSLGRVRVYELSRRKTDRNPLQARLIAEFE